MSQNDYDDDLEGNRDRDDDDERQEEEEREKEVEDALEEALELDTQSQIFLEMRRQNLDLLRIAMQIAGYSGDRGPLKRGEVESALRSIWDVFSEIYTWVDPEEDEGDEEDEEDDIEDEQD